MDKRKSTKALISILILVVGTILAIYISGYLHLLLSGEMMSLETIKFNRLIETIKDNKNAMTLFGAFESLVLLNTLFYLFSEDKLYKSELIEITPEISIPVSAGQKQFGSARFMTEEEKGEVFDILTIKKDGITKKLIEEPYDDFSNLEGGDDH